METKSKSTLSFGGTTSQTTPIGGAFSGTRVTRCTGKFVRYHYSKAMGSYYQKEHKNYL
jgi:hypothetical protein